MKAELNNQSTTRRRVLSEINITPFVDVMLVLLIIFMVTAPMMQQGLDVELPETVSAGISVPDEPFILLIKKNKKIFIGSAEISSKNLGQKIQAILKARKDKHIYIQADKNVAYSVVADTLAQMQSVGLYQVSLITTFKGR